MDKLHTMESQNEVLLKEIVKLKENNSQLSKRLDILYNVIEVSNYINSFVIHESLVQVINDMIIGILGVKYSTIYLMENHNLVVKSTNSITNQQVIYDRYYTYMIEGHVYMENRKIDFDNENGIKSIIGIPIKLGDKLIGYIVGEHTHYNFFNDEHKTFMNTVANQVAIVIENSHLYKEIDIAAKTDPLMKIYNRRTFFNMVGERITKLENEKYAIVMIDLDNFKKVNDSLGHQFGDKVLLETANIIKKKLLPTDILARYGGEEIILYIENISDVNETLQRIDKIRCDIQRNCISDDENSLYITISLGVGFSDYSGNNLTDVIKRADDMLYKAKHDGKNRVISSIDK